MAIVQKLNLTQLEVDSTEVYKVRVLWTSTQTPPHYNNVSHYAYLYYSINGGAETSISVRYKLPAETEQVILDTVLEIPVTGTDPVTLRARTWMNTYLSSTGTIELEESLELKPLASTITATNALIGSISEVLIKRSSLENTHSLRYLFGNKTGYISEDGSAVEHEVQLSTESVLFKVPEAFYEEIPFDVSGVCYLYCTTYSNGVQVGETQATSFTALIDEEVCKPSIMGRVVDANDRTVSITGDNSLFIRYHSTARVSVEAEPKFHALISRLWVEGVEVSTEQPVLDILNIQQGSITVYVEDSRGLTNAYLCELALIPYIHLTSTPQVDRDEPTSGDATLKFSGLCFDGFLGQTENVLKFEYSIDSGDLETAEAAYTVEDNRYAASLSLEELDYRKVFNFTVIVSDALESVEKSITLKKGIPVFDWGENDFQFHVPVSISSEGEPLQLLTLNGLSLFNLIYPKGIIIAFNESTDPNTAIGGVWTSLGDGRWYREN